MPKEAAFNQSRPESRGRSTSPRIVPIGVNERLRIESAIWRQEIISSRRFARQYAEGLIKRVWIHERLGIIDASKRQALLKRYYSSVDQKEPELSNWLFEDEEVIEGGKIVITTPSMRFREEIAAIR